MKLLDFILAYFIFHIVGCYSTITVVRRTDIVFQNIWYLIKSITLKIFLTPNLLFDPNLD